MCGLEHLLMWLFVDPGPIMKASLFFPLSTASNCLYGRASLRGPSWASDRSQFQSPWKMTIWLFKAPPRGSPEQIQGKPWILHLNQTTTISQKQVCARQKEIETKWDCRCKFSYIKDAHIFSLQLWAKVPGPDAVDPNLAPTLSRVCHREVIQPVFAWIASTVKWD